MFKNQGELSIEWKKRSIGVLLNIWKTRHLGKLGFTVFTAIFKAIPLIEFSEKRDINTYILSRQAAFHFLTYEMAKNDLFGFEPLTHQIETHESIVKRSDKRQKLEIFWTNKNIYIRTNEIY